MIYGAFCCIHVYLYIFKLTIVNIKQNTFAVHYLGSAAYFLALKSCENVPIASSPSV